jgi:protocatechuate 3,4-dioxygenase beta subunit
VRQDITSSFGDASGTAGGVPLTMRFALTDTSGAALAGAALYAWHCTAEGGYSMYSSGIEDQNYLRGVQEADADGTVTFTTVFPGCYDGRWPHVHFEVYSSVDDAIGGGSPIATSQLAFPEDACAEVYAADDRYSASVSNLQRVSLESDMVFQDSYASELGTMSGAIDDGLTVTLPVPVQA